MADPEKIGPFRIVRRLGVGGMGLVYEAIYVKNNRHVALKLLSPDLAAEPQLIARFEREMEILKKLKHPNIIRYYGGGAIDKRRFYAMELLPGGSLADKLKQAKQISWEQALDYAKQVAKALEHAHNAGVIHRDLKPANLLLTEGGALKLSDFGIARDTQRTALTAAGKTVGTMAYMAPEQIHGRDPIGRRTDLYALGCVLYQMLAGRPPFESETQPEMLFKHVEEVPRGVREHAHDCPPMLEALIAELLEKEPQERPFDALAVQVKLDEIKQAELGGGAPTSRAVTLATGGETMRRDLRDIERKTKKRKKKRRRAEEFVPIYERLYVLIPALLAVCGLIGWIIWPAGEKELYDQAATLMASDSAVDWKDARDRFIVPLRERFPESPHIAETELWLDQIAMHDAERQAMFRERAGKDPLTEAERLFREARGFEKRGDRLSALRSYRSIETTFADDGESRPYVNLASDRAETIVNDLGEGSETAQFIEQELAKADQMYRAGRVNEAYSRWRSLEWHYGRKPEFASLVQSVRDRLDPSQTDRVLAAARAEEEEAESAEAESAEPQP